MPNLPTILNAPNAYNTRVLPNKQQTNIYNDNINDNVNINVNINDNVNANILNMVGGGPSIVNEFGNNLSTKIDNLLPYGFDNQPLINKINKRKLFN